MSIKRTRIGFHVISNRFFRLKYTLHGLNDDVRGCPSSYIYTFITRIRRGER